MDRLSVRKQGPGFQIIAKAADLDGFSSSFRVDIPQRCISADLRFHSGDQLHGVEGLCQVIISPIESPSTLSVSSLLARTES